MNDVFFYVIGKKIISSLVHFYLFDELFSILASYMEKGQEKAQQSKTSVISSIYRPAVNAL